MPSVGIGCLCPPLLPQGDASRPNLASLDENRPVSQAKIVNRKCNGLVSSIIRIINGLTRVQYEN